MKGLRRNAHAIVFGIVAGLLVLSTAAVVWRALH